MPLAMPLTWHIKNAKHSQIGKFLQERFAHTSSLTADANRLLTQVSTLLPTVSTSSYPHGSIGMAIDYRIRYSFSITPSQELVAFTGARLLPHMSEVLMERPYSPELINKFFARLDTTLETVQPVRRRLEPAAEGILAHYCFVLSLFEEVYRNPRSAQKGRLFEPPPKKSVDELLDIPEDTWIDDLCAMASLFYDNYHDLLSHLCKLNPGFMGIGDIANSDGDLVVDRCLIEIKASIEPEIKPPMLRQLAGYVLLDYNDAYNIHSVSIYMARQGLLLPPWPVTDFLRLLTGDNTVTLTQLRQEFRTLAERVVQEKRKEEKTLQTRTVVEQPLTARHWMSRVMLGIAVLNAVLDNMLKMNDLNVYELTKEVEKYSKDITREISTAPHDVDDTVLEGVKRINGKLIELWQKVELMDGEKSTEELIFMARQLQVTISDVHSMLRTALQ